MNSLLSILAAAGVFSLEYQAKNQIELSDPNELPKPIMNGKVIIDRTHNKGISMSRFSDNPKKAKDMVILSMIIFHLVYLPLLLKRGRFLLKLGMGLIAGGAWSNFYDRIIRGYVVDYIRLPIKKISHIVFNLSDVLIAMGAVLSLIASFFDE